MLKNVLEKKLFVKLRVSFLLILEFVALSVSTLSFGMGIFDAIEKKDQKKIEEIVKDKSFNKNIILDNGDCKGATPLVFACLQNNTDAVKELLKIEYINVNYGFEGGDGPTPLLIAAQMGNFEVVKALLENAWIDINKVMKTTIGSANALHIICFFGDDKILELLLKRRDLKIDEVVKDGFKAGWTALELAIDSADFEKVTKLLKYGAKITDRAEKLAKSKIGFPEIYKEICKEIYERDLWRAVNANNFDFIKECLKSDLVDANNLFYFLVNKFEESEYFCFKEENAKNNLSKNWIDIFKIFISKGVDINQVSKSGHTILAIACGCNYKMCTFFIDMAKNFVPKSKDLDNEVATYKFKGPHFSSYMQIFKNGEIVEQDVSLCPDCWQENRELIYFLAKNGAKEIVFKDTRGGWVSFYLACYFGDLEIVKLLLKNGAIDFINANAWGKTPIYLACEAGMKILDKHESDQEDPEYYKSKIYDYVEKYINDHIYGVIKYLVEKGADVSLSTDALWENEVPLHVACQKIDLKMVQILLKGIGAKDSLRIKSKIIDDQGTMPFDYNFLYKRTDWIPRVSHNRFKNRIKIASLLIKNGFDEGCDLLKYTLKRDFSAIESILEMKKNGEITEEEYNILYGKKK